jgi:hypothetical protein
MEKFPVSLPSVMYLERSIEIEADSLEDAEALVHQMAKEGAIPRPRYTEDLADWTEVTDLPNARSHFIIDHEAIELRAILINACIAQTGAA